MLIETKAFEDRRQAYLDANPAPTSPPRHGMVWIPGGEFRMGSAQFYPEERPVRSQRVDGFWMDATPVTNRDFSRFVQATGYVTEAERAQAGQGTCWTSVFARPDRPVPLSDPRAWWRLAPADWRHPRGRKSGVAGLAQHPVVQVTRGDALEYCAWAGTRLPTEAEWEFAARGGLDGAVFAWGNRELAADGKRLANTWQGAFPHENRLQDGHLYTSPVKTYAPNGFGLFDVAGNVWEMTADFMDEPVSCCGSSNSGPQRMVIKGGSHLCAPSYCFRYRPAARSAQEIDGATSHIGFRTVVAPEGLLVRA